MQEEAGTELRTWQSLTHPGLTATVALIELMQSQSAMCFRTWARLGQAGLGRAGQHFHEALGSSGHLSTRQSERGIHAAFLLHGTRYP